MSDLPANYIAPTDDTRRLWTGRDDGPDAHARRWHQAVQMFDLRNTLEHCFDPTICFIGYASDLGVRMNEGRLGAALGPARLRSRMASLPCVEGITLLDCGDIIAADTVLATQEALANIVERVVRAGALPLILGGGHDSAFGQFLGIARANATPPACVNFDAHLDLRPIPESGPNSGTPFTQVWEWCKAHSAPFRYAALGIQRMGNTDSLFTRAEQAGATLVDADGFALDMIEVVMEAINDAVDEAEICLSVDLDVFASAFAPGVSAPTAMGIAPDAAFRRVLRGMLASGRVRAVEIAELCPPIDQDDRTARLGAAIAFEVASGFAEAAEDEDEDEVEDSTDSTDPREGGSDPSTGKGEDA
jgi:formiminoglutamase